jgi:hypothetical protein
MPPGQSPLRDEAAQAAEGAFRASVGGPQSAPGYLPLRPVNNRPSGRRIRCMDDPEILERVLEGLVNLS